VGRGRVRATSTFASIPLAHVKRDDRCKTPEKLMVFEIRESHCGWHRRGEDASALLKPDHGFSNSLASRLFLTQVFQHLT
jgi:hypothetical protein